MSRIEEIRERWAAWETHRDNVQNVFEFDDWLAVDDIEWLLERVEQLERERDGLKKDYLNNSRFTTIKLKEIEELEAENEALHTALKASGERREQLETERAYLLGRAGLPRNWTYDGFPSST